MVNNRLINLIVILLISFIFICGCAEQSTKQPSKTSTTAQTCPQQGGIICSKDQICSITATKAVDGLCCKGSCVSSDLKYPTTKQSKEQTVKPTSTKIDITTKQPIEPQAGTCGDNHCDIEETNSDCPTDCNGDNVPYSFLVIHSENNMPERTDEQVWQDLIRTVELCNRYNTPLTFAFWPGVVDYILEDQSRMDKIHEWQAQGHEVGIQPQGCYGQDGCDDPDACWQSDDGANAERLAAPYKIKSGSLGCLEYIPQDFIYFAGARFDGRTAYSLKYEMQNGQTVYKLHIKAGYGAGITRKVQQYDTLRPQEIYGFVNHGEGDLTILEEWLQFLSAKDPEGKRRKSMVDLMENYVIPENRYVTWEQVKTSATPRIAECSMLINTQVEVPDWYPETSFFNFGRCLDTRQYCEYNSAWCIPAWDTLVYEPDACTLKSMDNFVPFSTCPIVCGDSFCSTAAETPQNCPSDCTCGNGNCDSDETAKSCPADCSSGTAVKQASKTAQTQSTSKENLTKVRFLDKLVCKIPNLLNQEGYNNCISSKQTKVNQTKPSITKSSNASQPITTTTSENLIDYEDSPFAITPAISDDYYNSGRDLGIRWAANNVGFAWGVNQRDINTNEYHFKSLVEKGVSVGEQQLVEELQNIGHMYGCFEHDNPIVESLTDNRYYPSDTERVRNSWKPRDPEKLATYLKIAVERYDGDSDYGCIVANPNPDCYIAGDNEYPSQETIDAFEISPIKDWIIGNEPQTSFLKGGSGTGNYYAEYAKVAVPAIKSACSDCKIFNGGSTGGPKDYIQNLDLYLAQFQQMGNIHFDIIDLHWYGAASGDYRMKDGTTGVDVPDHFRSKLVEMGYPANMPIWITEMGSYSGALNGGKVEDSGYPAQTEQQQASDIVKRYVYSLTQNVKKIFFVWGITEGFENTDDYFDHTGLIYDGLGTSDLGRGVKKLSYYSYKFMTKNLEGSDWNNVQEIYNSGNVYAYRLIKNNNPIYVAWWDYWNEPSLTTKQVIIPISEITNAKITEAVPKYETGQEVTDFTNAFNIGSKSVINGQLTIDLGQSPVYIEETTENLGDYIPHAWLTPSVSADTNTGKTETTTKQEVANKSDSTKAASSCGDGYCDGIAGEKASCPQDCISTK